MRSILQALGFTLLLPLALSAKVDVETAKQLEENLTPLGAERMGNTDGSIPEWTGGITEKPESYVHGEHFVNPFEGEEILFTITSSNMEEYKEFLSPGQVAMFQRYPESFQMPIYPTHRSASYPEFVYEALKQNAINAELVADGNGLKNARVTAPFPIPQNGLEVIWNHLVRYRGEQAQREVAQAAPLANGSYQIVHIKEDIYYPYNNPESTMETLKNRVGYFLQKVTAPAYLAGTILLVHETLNQSEEPRSAWTYNPGQRRVRRAPNIAYDNPGTASDGQRTTDQYDMFNGAPDRYDWTLIGKKEIFVPYNAYPIQSPKIKYKDLLRAGHMNPEHTRYEKHRVWVLEANVKKEFKHIFPKRVFYLDEDSWQILVADQYDSRGQIWRLSEAHCLNYYNVPTILDTIQVHYDLLNGRYLVFGMKNEGRIENFDVELQVADFTPQRLRRAGRR
ncbi:MAG: outer membrane lipoprotein-sorting protein [Waddliaceae bacterium]|nr:outer membrane lipoprotein-sorting protein [Waddliaceae bacterium]